MTNSESIRFMALLIFKYLHIAFVVDNEEIVFENPPTEEENEGATCLVPDEDGKLYRVNTFAAMMEPVPHFSPRFGVRFELFTLSNTNEPQLLDAQDVDALKNSNFNPSRPTRFVTHGWRAGGSLTELFANCT